MLVVVALAVVVAAVLGDSVQALILIGIGIAQPFVQEIIVKDKLSGVWAQLVTWLASYGIAFVVIWITGGLVSGEPMPALNLADPSGFFVYWAARLLPVRLAASFTYQALRERIHDVAGSAPTPAPAPTPIAPVPPAG